MSYQRRTKIVVTLGPALDDLNELEKVVNAGADVFRANFSHGTFQDHQRRIMAVRELAKKAGREVAVFADLQGPKIRVSRFKNKKVILEEGAEFVFDAAMAVDAGDEHCVGIDYKELPNDVYPEDKLLVDDGRLIFRIKQISGTRIICETLAGGELSNNKGINRQGGGLSAKALTDKDREDINLGAKLNVDYFAVSFPRSAADIEEARELIRATNSEAGIIAKIERAEAIPVLDEIIKASNAVMVARGDLGVEIGDAQLPAVQKQIIQRARALDKPVITATQMMESMIQNVIPTRAEVFDVAHAVSQNTDAVMLSAETASGRHPHLVVEAMSRICKAAEERPETATFKHYLERRFCEVDEAIAMSVMYCASHVDIAAVICFTESGSTPLLMSRMRTSIPIFAMTRKISTERKINLYRGVFPVYFDLTEWPVEEIDEQAILKLKKQGVLKKGDMVIITKGDVVGIRGHTNTFKMSRVQS